MFTSEHHELLKWQKLSTVMEHAISMSATRKGEKVQNWCTNRYIANKSSIKSILKLPRPWVPKLVCVPPCRGGGEEIPGGARGNPVPPPSVKSPPPKLYCYFWFLSCQFFFFFFWSTSFAAIWGGGEGFSKIKKGGVMSKSLGTTALDRSLHCAYSFYWGS